MDIYMQKELKCPICKGKTEYRFKNDDRDIYGCVQCETQFTHPMVEYKGEYVANNLYSPWYGWLTFNRQSKIIKKMINRNYGRILDFGCGGGQFLSHMDGWTKYGIEHSQEAKDIAREKRIMAFSSLEEADIRDNYFDVVTMFATIEHLPNPKDITKELCRILRNGGLFVVMTGDVTSQKAMRLGDKWHMYKSLEHYYFFSATGLDILMAKLGNEKTQSFHTDGGMYGIPYLDKVPIINRLPLFDHYYGYYRKVK